VDAAAAAEEEEEEIAIFKRFAELPPDVGKWASGHLLPPDVSFPFWKSQS